jgi:hypothetical protein
MRYDVLIQPIRVEKSVPVFPFALLHLSAASAHSPADTAHRGAALRFRAEGGCGETGARERRQRHARSVRDGCDMFKLSDLQV